MEYQPQNSTMLPDMRSVRPVSRSNLEIRQGMLAAGVPPESVDMLLLHRARQMQTKSETDETSPCDARTPKSLSYLDLSDDSNMKIPKMQSAASLTPQMLAAGPMLYVKAVDKVTRRMFHAVTKGERIVENLTFTTQADKSIKHIKLERHTDGDQTHGEDVGECLIHRHFSTKTEIRYSNTEKYQSIADEGRAWTSQKIRNGARLRWYKEHQAINPNFKLYCTALDDDTDVLVECHINIKTDYMGFIRISPSVVSDIDGLSQLLLITWAMIWRISKEIAKLISVSSWSSGGTDTSATASIIVAASTGTAICS